MKRLTPVLFVERVEDALPFWTDRLGFSVTIEVPGNAGLGFAALERGGVEVMLQSRDALRDDLPALATGTFDLSGMSLFVEIGQPLDNLLPALDGLEVVVPRRSTFYGSDEIAVREPASGAVVVLAAMGEDAGGS